LKTGSIKIITPQTDQQFEAYFLTRYEVLRKPWGQPKGSERDGQEDTSMHFMAINEHEEVLGVCRLQFNSPDEAQLRYMGVTGKSQGSGVGRMLLNAAETAAKAKTAAKMILQSRETAVGFYERSGYTVKEKSYLMWGEIQHYLMEKTL
jgi:predicted GNAT family N-acyltransferase